MGQAQHSRSRHSRRGGSLGVLGAALAALALLLVGGAGGYLAAGAGSDETAGAPAAQPTSSTSTTTPGAVAGNPTVLGRVTRVGSGDAVMVQVGATEESVRVLGLDTPDLGTSPGAATVQCGSREALAYADQRLTGQMVTLVPDATLPERDERGARLAYVVLRSQLNFTDLALNDGIGRADTSRPLWYAEVFAREQADAERAGRGIWGQPCDEQL